MVGGVVQLFYAWRLKVLTDGWVLVSIIIIGSLVTWCKSLSPACDQSSLFVLGGCVGTAIAAGMYVLHFTIQLRRYFDVLDFQRPVAAGIPQVPVHSNCLERGISADGHHHCDIDDVVLGGQLL